MYGEITMAIYEWKKFLIPYAQAVEELKVKFKSIRKEYRQKNEYSPIEFVTGRVKEISSIIEKANKLNLSLDNVEEMEDITGIRIMCQFVEDIQIVVDLIKNRSDMEILYEKDYIKNFKESGYRSYHLVIKYPINMSSGAKYILAEIQIRTLAMNFWATIEHSLNYKYKHDIPKDIKSKLKNAADIAFKLDEQMLEIKDEIKDAQQLFEVKSAVVSDIMNNILTLYSLGRVNEATMYHNQLNRLIEEGGISDFNYLQSMIKICINKYRS
jgi:putative GTP pyrophosphokinase